MRIDRFVALALIAAVQLAVGNAWASLALQAPRLEKTAPAPSAAPAPFFAEVKGDRLGLSPGKLRLALDRGGGGDAEHVAEVPFEQDRFLKESLLGLAAIGVTGAAFAITMIVGLFFAPHGSTSADVLTIVGFGGMFFVAPAVGALAETIYGNQSEYSRVSFVPPFLTGIAYVAAEGVLFAVLGLAFPKAPDLLVELVATPIAFGLPFAQAAVMNAFRVPLQKAPSGPPGSTPGPTPGLRAPPPPSKSEPWPGERDLGLRPAPGEMQCQGRCWRVNVVSVAF